MPVKTDRKDESILIICKEWSSCWRVRPSPSNRDTKLKLVARNGSITILDNMLRDATGLFTRSWTAALVTLLSSTAVVASSEVSGRVLAPQGKVVPGATVRLESASGDRLNATSDRDGRYAFSHVAKGEYHLKAEANGFAAIDRSISLAGPAAVEDFTLSQLAAQHQSIVITSKVVEPAVDLRNAEVFNRTLFTRDDQVLQQLSAGIDAGQHLSLIHI